MNSIMEARKKKKLSTAQRQAVIKLIEKKEINSLKQLASYLPTKC